MEFQLSFENVLYIKEILRVIIKVLDQNYILKPDILTLLPFADTLNYIGMIIRGIPLATKILISQNLLHPKIEYIENISNFLINNGFKNVSNENDFEYKYFKSQNNLLSELSKNPIGTNAYITSLQYEGNYYDRYIPSDAKILIGLNISSQSNKFILKRYLIAQPLSYISHCEFIVSDNGTWIFGWNLNKNHIEIFENSGIYIKSKIVINEHRRFSKILFDEQRKTNTLIFDSSKKEDLPQDTIIPIFQTPCYNRCLSLLLYVNIIRHAKNGEYIYLTSPYYSYIKEFVEEIIRALYRGVKIFIIYSKSDMVIPQIGNEVLFQYIQSKAPNNFFLYKYIKNSKVLHKKIMIKSDKPLSNNMSNTNLEILFGTANLDARSCFFQCENGLYLSHKASLRNFISSIPLYNTICEDMYDLLNNSKNINLNSYLYPLLRDEIFHRSIISIL